MESLNTNVRVYPPRAASDQSESIQCDLAQPSLCSEAFDGATAKF